MALHPKESYYKVKDFLTEYERYLSPGALIFGFIIDSLTLRRADVWLDNLILLSYLVLSGLCIFLLNTYASGRFQRPFMQRVTPWLPLLMQFAFGGLFSGFVVLYSRSTSFAASWPFMLILGALLVGNEYLRKGYHRVEFQLSIFFIALFSYLIFAVPVALNTIGPWVFILSGAVALTLIILMVRVLTRFALPSVAPHARKVKWIIIGIFSLFNLLYFTHMIPPIPLSLNDLIIAHDIDRQGNGYLVTYEPKRWYHLFHDNDPTYHRHNAEPVYAFSSIYAPTDLKTTVFHEWEAYDESRKEWLPATKVQYAITGGRQEGFRGFSLKTVISPGKWRVSVKTKNGQVIGRTTFTLVQSSTPAQTITVSK